MRDCETASHPHPNTLSSRGSGGGARLRDCESPLSTLSGTSPNGDIRLFAYLLIRRFLILIIVMVAMPFWFCEGITEARAQEPTPTAQYLIYLPILLKRVAPMPMPNLPDLVVSQFNITDFGNGTTQVDVTVQNQSVTPVEYDGQIHNFHVAVYAVSSGQELKADTEPIISWGVQGSLFGAWQSHTFSQSFTRTLLGGTAPYTFYAWADPWDMVVEPNDNLCVLPFPAGIGSCNNLAVVIR